MSASVSFNSSTEAAFSPCGPWPTIDVGPNVVRSTLLTQEAGTSALPAAGNRAIDPAARTAVRKALRPDTYPMGSSADCFSVCRQSSQGGRHCLPLAFCERHGCNNNGAFDHQLHWRTYAQQNQPIVERADDEAPEQCAQDVAAPAEQAATAENDGSDHVKLHALHDIRTGGVRSRGQDEGRETGEGAGEDEGERGYALDLNAGIERCGRIPAGRIDPPAENIVVKQENADHRRRQHQRNRRGDAEQRPFAEY